MQVFCQNNLFFSQFLRLRRCSALQFCYYLFVSRQPLHGVQVFGFQPSCSLMLQQHDVSVREHGLTEILPRFCPDGLADLARLAPDKDQPVLPDQVSALPELLRQSGLPVSG